MPGLLDNAEIKIPCENCGHKTTKTIGWIKSNKEFKCSCGTHITITTDQFKREIVKVEKAYSDLQRTLRK